MCNTHINKHLAHLLRGVKLAEDSSDARLGRTELCGVTEGGNSEDGAEGATLVLLPREGDSCFGVEELDVADGEGVSVIYYKTEAVKEGEDKSLMHDRKKGKTDECDLLSKAAEVLAPLKPFCQRCKQSLLNQY